MHHNDVNTITASFDIPAINRGLLLARILFGGKGIPGSVGSIDKFASLCAAAEEAAYAQGRADRGYGVNAPVILIEGSLGGIVYRSLSGQSELRVLGEMINFTLPNQGIKGWVSRTGGNIQCESLAGLLILATQIWEASTDPVMDDLAAGMFSQGLYRLSEGEPLENWGLEEGRFWQAYFSAARLRDLAAEGDVARMLTAALAVETARVAAMQIEAIQRSESSFAGVPVDTELLRAFGAGA